MMNWVTPSDTRSVGPNSIWDWSAVLQISNMSDVGNHQLICPWVAAVNKRDFNTSFLLLIRMIWPTSSLFSFVVWLFTGFHAGAPCFYACGLAVSLMCFLFLSPVAGKVRKPDVVNKQINMKKWYSCVCRFIIASKLHCNDNVPSEIYMHGVVMF